MTATVTATVTRAESAPTAAPARKRWTAVLLGLLPIEFMM